MARIKKLIYPKFVLHYFALTCLLLFLFRFLKLYYITDFSISPYSIDEYVLRTGDFFNSAYITQAKISGYNHLRYYFSFFVIDMIFPLIYTSMFLSAVAGLKRNWLHTLFLVTIISGCAFDYLEDFSFAFFLSAKENTLAVAVAFFSTMKSIMYVINVIVSACCLLYYWKTGRTFKLAGRRRRLK